MDEASLKPTVERLALKLKDIFVEKIKKENNSIFGYLYPNDSYSGIYSFEYVINPGEFDKNPPFFPIKWGDDDYLINYLFIICPTVEINEHIENFTNLLGKISRGMIIYQGEEYETYLPEKESLVKKKLLSRTFQSSFEKYYDFIKEINVKKFIDSTIIEYDKSKESNKIYEFKKKYATLLQFFEIFEDLSYYFFTGVTEFELPIDLLYVFHSMTLGSFESCGIISITKKDSNSSEEIPTFKIESTDDTDINKKNIQYNFDYNVIFHTGQIDGCSYGHIRAHRAIQFHTHPVRFRYNKINMKTMDKYFSILHSDIISPPSRQDLISYYNRSKYNFNDVFLIFANGGIYVIYRPHLPHPTFEMYESAEYIRETETKQDDFIKNKITEDDWKTRMAPIKNKMLLKLFCEQLGVNDNKIEPSDFRNIPLNDTGNPIIKKIKESFRNYDRATMEEIHSFLIDLLFQTKERADLTKKIVEDDYLKTLKQSYYGELLEIKFLPIRKIKLKTELKTIIEKYSYPPGISFKVYPRMLKYFGLKSLRNL